MRLSSKLPHGSVFLLPDPEDIFPAAAAALRGVESVSVVGSVVRSVDPRMDLFLFLLLKSDVLVRSAQKKKNMLQLTAVSVQQYNKLPHSDH